MEQQPTTRTTRTKPRTVAEQKIYMHRLRHIENLIHNGINNANLMRTTSTGEMVSQLAERIVLFMKDEEQMAVKSALSKADYGHQHHPDRGELMQAAQRELMQAAQSMSNAPPSTDHDYALRFQQIKVRLENVFGTKFMADHVDQIPTFCRTIMNVMAQNDHKAIAKSPEMTDLGKRYAWYANLLYGADVKHITPNLFRVIDHIVDQAKSWR